MKVNDISIEARIKRLYELEPVRKILDEKRGRRSALAKKAKLTPAAVAFWLHGGTSKPIDRVLPKFLAELEREPHV